MLNRNLIIRLKAMKTSKTKDKRVMDSERTSSYLLTLVLTSIVRNLNYLIRVCENLIFFSTPTHHFETEAKRKFCECGERNMVNKVICLENVI